MSAGTACPIPGSRPPGSASGLGPAAGRGESANSVAHGWAPHGSHHVRFRLAPGDTKEVIFLLGYWENREDQKFDPPGSTVLNKALVRPVIDRWLRPETVAEGFSRLRESWSSSLSVLTVETPDDDANRMANVTGGVAESVFIGGLFVLAATELAQIAERRGATADASGHRTEAEKIARAVAEHGWDGQWFRRSYDHAGHAVGSAANAEGKIFIEPQGMCIMSGIGLGNGMAVKVLASVRDQLASDHGILLLQPAYTRYHLELGEISSYPPGYKENGSVFCHTNPWVMIAEAMAGHGDAAFGYYKLINPSAREQVSDVRRCEPYVYAQMIAGPDAPTYGEAKNSWLTGTAAWNLVAITSGSSGSAWRWTGYE
jgi:cellobiose phosphorylase